MCVHPTQNLQFTCPNNVFKTCAGKYSQNLKRDCDLRKKYGLHNSTCNNNHIILQFNSEFAIIHSFALYILCLVEAVWYRLGADGSGLCFQTSVMSLLIFSKAGLARAITRNTTNLNGSHMHPREPSGPKGSSKLFPENPRKRFAGWENTGLMGLVWPNAKNPNSQLSQKRPPGPHWRACSTSCPLENR